MIQALVDTRRTPAIGLPLAVIVAIAAVRKPVVADCDRKAWSDGSVASGIVLTAPMKIAFEAADTKVENFQVGSTPQRLLAAA